MRVKEGTNVVLVSTGRNNREREYTEYNGALR